MESASSGSVPVPLYCLYRLPQQSLYQELARLFENDVPEIPLTSFPRQVLAPECKQKMYLTTYVGKCIIRQWSGQ